MRKTLIFLIVILYVINVFCQTFEDEVYSNANPTKNKNKTKEQPQFYNYNLGLGAGLDYGGFGGRISYLPIKEASLFIGIGYAMVDVGYNIGTSWRITPDKPVCFFLGAMYGYNGVIKINGASQYDKLYYGPSFDVGMEIRSGKMKNFLNLEFIVPVRPNKFYDDWNAIKKNPQIKVQSEPLSFGYSIGYHFVL